MAVVKRSMQYRGDRAQNTLTDGMEGLTQQLDTYLTDIDDRLDVWEQSRVMPLDVYTYLYWPLDEESTSAIAYGQGVGKSSITQLTHGTDAFPGAVANQATRCVMYKNSTGVLANRTSSGALNTAPTGTSGSISCKFRPGQLAAASDTIFGYYNAAGTGVIFCRVDPNGSVQGNVRIGGVNFNVNSSVANYVSAGDWHAVVITYDGATIRVWVDGQLANSQAQAGAVEWGLAGNKLWRVSSNGITTNGLTGSVRDCRVHSVARPQAWVEEDWLRFNREWIEP